MLSREIMGLVALAVLWVNVLVIVAAAGQRVRGVWAWRRRFVRARRQGQLVVGRVTQGSGPDGTFAVRRVRRVGRARTDTRRRIIRLSEHSSVTELLGGVVQLDNGQDLSVQPTADAEIWLGDSELDFRAPSEAAAFDRAYQAASTFKGLRMDSEHAVRTGDRVWIDFSGHPHRQTPEAPAAARWVVATVSPLGWCARRLLMGLGFTLFSVGAALAITRLAIWDPLFGPISTIGGLLGLVYFLGLQPLGVAFRNATCTPGQQLATGVWGG